MPKTQVERRTENTKGKLKAATVEVISDVAGDERNSAKYLSAPQTQKAMAISRSDQKIVSDLWEGSITIYSL